MRSYPYAFHVALDGSGLNGLDGRAGVCIFLYDPATGAHAYKVTYYDGVAGGHAPNVDPDRRVGFLGNMGQHLLIYDAATAEEVDRVSTLRFEIPDSTIKSSTHVVWLDGSEFLAAIGEELLEVRPEPAHQGRGRRPAPVEDPPLHETDGVRPLRRLRRHGPPRER